eukprot:gene24808-biopygen13478
MCMPRAAGMGGWVARCGGGGSGIYGMFRCASRRANPRIAPRVRPHPPRGPGARRGRMGPEVGPAFQRWSRRTLFPNLGVRLAETVEKAGRRLRAVCRASCRRSSGRAVGRAVGDWGTGAAEGWRGSPYVHFSRAEQSSTGPPSFAPRCEPPRVRALGAQRYGWYKTCPRADDPRRRGDRTHVGAGIGSPSSSEISNKKIPAPGAERRSGTSTCTTVRSLTDLDAFPPVLPHLCHRVAQSGRCSLGRRWAGRAQGGGDGGVHFPMNAAMVRLFGTLLASSRRDANRTRRAQSGAR